MTKSIIATLKEELGVEEPSQILEKVRLLQDGRGPIGVILTMDRANLRYNHALTGVLDLQDWKNLGGMIRHFLQEVLDPQIHELEIEAEVQRRLSEDKKSPAPDE